MMPLPLPSGTETSLDELATTLLRVMGSDVLPEYGPARTVNPVPRRLADTTDAWNEIGFRSTISLEEGMRQLVDWWYSEQLVGARRARVLV